MALGNTSYVTIQKADGTYEWRQISSSGGGASASDELPLGNGTASPGVSPTFSRGDHVHPTDETLQPVLISAENIKTINGESVLGSGNLTVKAVGTSGGEKNVIESVSLNGNPLGVVDKNVDVPIKTINGQSVIGSGDLTVECELEDLHVGPYTYNGLTEVYIPTTESIKVDQTQTERIKSYVFATQNTYCTGDIEARITCRPAIQSMAISDVYSGGGSLVIQKGTGEATYVSPVDGVAKNSPACDLSAQVTTSVAQSGWVDDGASGIATNGVYVTQITLATNTGFQVIAPDGTVWTIECGDDGNVYTY